MACVSLSTAQAPKTFLIDANRLVDVKKRLKNNDKASLYPSWIKHSLPQAEASMTT
jgi:hypothetical protein